MNRRNSIGLRHILEGAIRIAEGLPIDPIRRKYILATTTRFLNEAEKGSDFARDRAWVVPPSESDALESYSFVESYLSGSEGLDERIRITKESLELIENNEVVDSKRLAVTVQLLKSLLDSMKTERRVYSEESWYHRYASADG